MWKYSKLFTHVVDPDDIGRLRADLDGRSVSGRILRLVLIRAVISIRHPGHVEADHFAPVGHKPHAISFHGRRGAEADVFPVAHLASAKLGDDELPGEGTVLLIEGHEDPAVALLLFIAGRFVVGSNDHQTTGYDGVSVSLGTELRRPLDVLGFGKISGLIILEIARMNVGWQIVGNANHVPGRGATPHGPILGDLGCGSLGFFGRTGRAVDIFDRISGIATR